MKTSLGLAALLLLLSGHALAIPSTAVPQIFQPLIRLTARYAETDYVVYSLDDGSELMSGTLDYPGHTVEHFHTSIRHAAVNSSKPMNRFSGNTFGDDYMALVTADNDLQVGRVFHTWIFHFLLVTVDIGDSDPSTLLVTVDDVHVNGTVNDATFTAADAHTVSGSIYHFRYFPTALNRQLLTHLVVEAEITCSHDAVVQVGGDTFPLMLNPPERGWQFSAPSIRPGEVGKLLGRRFLFYSHWFVTIFAEEDDTDVVITDLSDGDDSTSFNLPTTTTVWSKDLKTLGAPYTCIGPCSGLLADAFDNDVVLVESNKPIRVFVGPTTPDVGNPWSITLSYSPTSAIGPGVHESFINGRRESAFIYSETNETTVEYEVLQSSDVAELGPLAFAGWSGVGPFYSRVPLPNTVNQRLIRVRASRPVNIFHGDMGFCCSGDFVPRFEAVAGTLPPIARLTVPGTACTGEPVVLDGSESFDQDDEGEGVVSWEFFINGVSQGVGNSPLLTTTFASPGVYVIELEVVDNEGEVSEQRASETIEVVDCACPSGPCTTSTLVGGVCQEELDPNKYGTTECPRRAPCTFCFEDWQCASGTCDPTYHRCTDLSGNVPASCIDCAGNYGVDWLGYCRTKCTYCRHCQPGFWCNEGGCVARFASGSSCSVDTQCLSDVCLHGACV